MKKLLFLFLFVVTSITFGDGLIVNSYRLATGGGGGGGGYVVSEDWEGDNTGSWNKQNNASLVDFDFTSSPLEGSQSLHVTGDTGDTAPPYAFRLTPFTEQSVCNAFFIAKFIQGPTADDFNRETAWLVDYPANAHLIEMDLYRFSSTDYRLRIFDGTAGTATTTAGFALNTPIAIWLRYTKGSGSTGKAEVWWCDASGGAGTYIKPADGSSHYAIRSDGNYTTGVRNIQLGAILRGGHGTEVVYDHVRVAADGVDIGDNPP